MIDFNSVDDIDIRKAIKTDKGHFDKGPNHPRPSQTTPPGFNRSYENNSSCIENNTNSTGTNILYTYTIVDTWYGTNLHQAITRAITTDINQRLHHPAPKAQCNRLSCAFLSQTNKSENYQIGVLFAARWYGTSMSQTCEKGHIGAPYWERDDHSPRTHSASNIGFCWSRHQNPSWRLEPNASTLVRHKVAPTSNQPCSIIRYE